MNAQEIKKSFIGLAVSGLPTMNRQDAEGEFIRDTCKLKLSGAGGEIVCVTASGKVLGGKDLQKVLEAWNKLPQSERKPGAVQVGERGKIDTAKVDRAYPTPPPGTLILKIHARFLGRADEGHLRHVTPKDFIGDDKVRAQMVAAYPAAFARERLDGTLPKDVLEHKRRGIAERISEAQPDFMWLTEAEWKSLVPANPKKGDQFAVPAALTKRIFVLHLDPNRLVGEPDRNAIVRSGELNLTVEDISPTSVRLRLDGSALLRVDFETAQKTGQEGEEARLVGFLNYDLQKKSFTRFDIVAIGDTYGLLSPGLGHLTYSRPGRSPYGVAFELVSGSGGTSTPEGYFGTGK